MKTNLTSLLFIAILFIFSACKKDKEVEPANQKFIGDYMMTINCNFVDGTTVNDQYVLSVRKGSANEFVEVHNIFGSDQTLIAAVNGNTFTITQGMIDVENIPVEVNGTGTVNGNSLTLNYNLQVQSQNIGNCMENGSRN